MSVHRCIKSVSTALVNKLLGSEVRWPRNPNSIPEMFMRAGNMPLVGGVVDGSLIKIDAPNENEAAYDDRKGNHSINLMVVCGPNLEFFYCNARWPGSVHDSRVLRCSSLAQQWENGWRPFPNAIILGDSGYGLRKWLITPNIPVQIERNPALMRFLVALKSTRCMVENSLGILKEKFPCLNYVRLQPVFASNVIQSCVILHNIEKRLGSNHYTPYINYNPIEDNEEVLFDAEVGIDFSAIQVLNNLIERFT